jgi:hypothetical protein
MISEEPQLSKVLMSLFPWLLAILLHATTFFTFNEKKTLKG